MGSFRLAAIPVEATTAAGWTIRREAGASVIVGLADEYLGYTASAAEYRLQQYEGASTLLGPGQAAALARLLSLAARGQGDPPSPGTVPAATFAAGPRRKNAFGPETLLVRRRRNMIEEDLEPLLPRRLQRLEARIPRFEWEEDQAGDWRQDIRQVAIYTKVDGVWRELDTDRGLNFLTVLTEASYGKRRYAALWIPPGPIPETLQFRVRTATGKEFCQLQRGSDASVYWDGLRPVAQALVPANVESRLDSTLLPPSKQASAGVPTRHARVRAPRVFFRTCSWPWCLRRTAGAERRNNNEPKQVSRRVG